MEKTKKRVSIVYNRHAASRRSRRHKPLYLFVCTDKKTKEIKQGIAYEDGSFSVGYDCWRSLDKMDCCSYNVRSFSSYTNLCDEVVIVKQRKPKAYYISKEENIC